MGSWPAYVHNDLLPRLHGFELMMTPYTIAHLKLSIALKLSDFRMFNNRLGIYLTNSLEEGANQQAMICFWFGRKHCRRGQSRQNMIKNETPIMVVMGNPPYNVKSKNKGAWILSKLDDYKKGLGEKKINLDDDYIKFIRLAEHFIEKNKTGIVAMITNNSFLDGITHRQMRKHLLETFEKIYVLDLHGSSRKKELNKEDKNVFDIQQGVAISIFVRKSENKTGLGVVYHSELYGSREAKYEILSETEIEKVKWKNIEYNDPYYFFVPKDFGLEEQYKNGVSLTEIFHEYNSGIQTKRDDTTVQFSKKDIKKVIDDFQTLSDLEIRSKYQLPEDGRDWKVEWAKEDLSKKYSIEQILYRPFDVRYTAYSGNSKGFIAYPREKTNVNVVGRDNITLLSSRSMPANQPFDRAYVSKSIADIHAASDQTYVFPLYLYPVGDERVSNLNKEITIKIESIIGQTNPEDIYDYIYAVLYSPRYRNKYKEFLKIDFPRVPYPKDTKTFKKLVKLGTELRELHLLESPKVDKYITTYPASGSDTVEKVTYKDGKIYINAEQYFGKVPEIAWNFYIGGYQPAQKWLKDRKGRELSNEDIEHYQKMIVALTETYRIMKEIDEIDFLRK